mmetsp:Transcript_32849/g.75121  ORF Transcript_32849/g.75121 Transcript_32849/m.75121 type:complete len:549 (-) Transcript_32849:159-1805(-)|eukprot:CAMPEP_0114554862 /NCGR_PEP_ID=MMETSP0114-20121206/8437_1 /TAXON_ID=31324 /ORGANISM="Goniomonas sp, Strain m" /LENGTH=548 /DNA_ID=CAMNT_0001739939 /DNA_START=14 /DNA_END=1660 /DNA_ORIENTATION=-
MGKEGKEGKEDKEKKEKKDKKEGKEGKEKKEKKDKKDKKDSPDSGDSGDEGAAAAVDGERGLHLPRDDSRFATDLQRCLEDLEHDFAAFDKDGSHCIDLVELMSAWPVRTNAERLHLSATVSKYMQMVDVDGSGFLDFHEFLYLVYLICSSGDYRDLVPKAVNPRGVKAVFLHLMSLYGRYDRDNSRRLSLPELTALLQSIGQHPPDLEAQFDKLKSSPDRPHIDFVRFLRLLYMLLRPQGVYNRQAPRPPKPDRLVATYAEVQKPTKPARPHFDTINPREVVKGKQLGKGGQGCVWLAEYHGVKCGYKEMLAGCSPEIAQDLQEEAKLLQRLDHPNVHFMLGGRFDARDPPLCMLTELCPNGSLFDCYYTNGKRFTPAAKFMFAMQCAQGINVLHTLNPPFIHRDIKSLNVFMDEQYNCKVADFGMACSVESGPFGMAGTVQWAPPEALQLMRGGQARYDTKFDVFSYAVLLTEIVGLQGPYFDQGLADQNAICDAVLRRDARPTMPRQAGPRTADLIKRCWSRDPHARPSMSQVISELEHCKAEFR